MVQKYEDGLFFLNGSIFGNDTRFGNWTQFGDGTMFGHGTQFGDGNKFGPGTQFGKRTKFGNCTRFGKRTKFGNCTQFGDWTQFGDGTKFGNWTKFGDGAQFGNGCIFEGLKFHQKERQYYIKIDHIGSRFAETYFFNSIDGIYVRSGCFFGSESDFLKKVEETHGNNIHSIEYITAIDYVKNIFKKRMEAYNE